jgi:hypothetical protein
MGCIHGGPLAFEKKLNFILMTTEQLYSITGGIFLLKWGQFLYFVYPEWLVFDDVCIQAHGSNDRPTGSYTVVSP